jgi:heat shock protein HslJ
MTVKPVTALLCLVAIGLTACDDAEFDPGRVTGVEWRLESLQRPDGAVLPADPGRYTLSLAADGSARVRSDCNSCGGRYTLSGSSLAVDALGCTRVFCGDDSLDQPFVRALQAARSVDGDESRLVVSGTEGTLRFTR